MHPNVFSAWLHSGIWLHCAHTLYWSPSVAAQWYLTALCPCILMFSQRGCTVVSDYTVPIHYTGLPARLHSGIWLHCAPSMQLVCQSGCTVETDCTVPTHANGLPAWLHSGNWLHCAPSMPMSSKHGFKVVTYIILAAQWYLTTLCPYMPCLVMCILYIFLPKLCHLDILDISYGCNVEIHLGLM